MWAIIISIITTAGISYIFFRWQNKKNSIVHFTLNTYDIGSGLSKEFPEFKLTYDNSELFNSVRVLSGGFMNNGKKDIPDNPSFELIMPEKCKVRALKIAPSDRGMTIGHNLDEENVVRFLVNGIFKSDEYINYKMIVETPDNIGDLDDELKFNHRIVNTEKIKNIFVGSIREKNKWKRRKIWLMIGYIVVIVFLNCWASINPRMSIKVYDNSSNEKVDIHVSPNSNLYEGNVLWGKNIPIEEFEKNYRFSPITTFNEYMPQVYIWGGITIIIILLFMVTLIDFSGKGHVINVLSKNKKR